jgi:hypothetical protein
MEVLRPEKMPKTKLNMVTKVGPKHTLPRLKRPATTSSNANTGDTSHDSINYTGKTPFSQAAAMGIMGAISVNYCLPGAHGWR